MDLIAGRGVSVTGLILITALTVVMFFAAHRCVLKMWQGWGGIKLWEQFAWVFYICWNISGMIWCCLQRYWHQFLRAGQLDLSCHFWKDTDSFLGATAVLPLYYGLLTVWHFLCVYCTGYVLLHCSNDDSWGCRTVFRSSTVLLLPVFPAAFLDGKSNLWKQSNLYTAIFFSCRQLDSDFAEKF